MDGFNFSEETRARLASETSRLTALVRFLSEHGLPVMEFWEWDRCLNPGCWRDGTVVRPASANVS